MKLPRILVSSVDPWSERVGSDTLTSLLSQFDRSTVASINIRARKSDSRVAGRYFHILERRVIKSIFNPSIVTGEAYRAVALDEESDTPESVEEGRRYSGKHLLGRWFSVFAREILWKIGHWKSKELDSFVESFSPDVFFFPIESYIHFNRLNIYIIKHFKPARIIGYMWDDNFTFKQQPYNLFYLIHRLWLRRGVRQLVKQCDVLFAISPRMKKELDEEFGVNSILLTKPVKSPGEFTPYSVNYPIRLLYSGKLIIGRDRTVADIVDAIRKVNADGGQKVILEVYSGTMPRSRVKGRIDVPGASYLRGFIPQKQIWEAQQKADVLVFAESLSSCDMTARLSFSTKITDYLSTGKCIWAVGSKGLSPIDYLKDKDAAVVSTTKEEIITNLRWMVNHPEVILSYARKGYECGVTNHNQEMILTRFKEAICG